MGCGNLLLLIPYYHLAFKKKFNNYKDYRNELSKIFFIGSLGCGVCGAFPFLAGQTTTVINMGIIYSSSPIFIILDF